jgi:chemotaxis response regulator CheB
MALRVLYVEKDPEARQRFQVFFEELGQHSDINLSLADSEQEAMSILSSLGGEVVVIGETLADVSALTFANTLAKKMPLIDCAMVSSQSHEDFHEATEGLGIFMQLSSDPGPDAAEEFLGKLQKIRILLGT